tara:strand:+ start:2034 stop:2453 length:420 start_codon:yes stop_codon:yes gene_type:complete
MKTAKITNIQKKPDFITNDNKTLYVFELSLDNGDTGAIFKQKDNAYVEVGQEISYELTERGTIKIQRENSNFSSNRPAPDNDRQLSIIRQSSLKAAIDLVVHEKIEIHELIKTADSFVDWVQGKKQAEYTNNSTDKAPF